jgi:hypothetical protein
MATAPQDVATLDKAYPLRGRRSSQTLSSRTAFLAP